MRTGPSARPRDRGAPATLVVGLWQLSHLIYDAAASVSVFVLIGIVLLPLESRGSAQQRAHDGVREQSTPSSQHQRVALDDPQPVGHRLLDPIRLHERRR